MKIKHSKENILFHTQMFEVTMVLLLLLLLTRVLGHEHENEEMNRPLSKLSVVSTTTTNRSMYIHNNILQFVHTL